MTLVIELRTDTLSEPRGYGEAGRQLQRLHGGWRGRTRMGSRAERVGVTLRSCSCQARRRVRRLRAICWTGACNRPALAVWIELRRLLFATQRGEKYPQQSHCEPNFASGAYLSRAADSPIATKLTHRLHLFKDRLREPAACTLRFWQGSSRPRRAPCRSNSRRSLPRRSPEPPVPATMWGGAPKPDPGRLRVAGSRCKRNPPLGPFQFSPPNHQKCQYVLFPS